MPTKITDDTVYFYHGDSFLSNHHASPFILNGTQFSSVEQFYIYCKCLAFKDKVMADAILNTEDPVQIKKLAVHIQKSEYNNWEEIQLKMMAIGVFAKFAQNPNLSALLMNTGSKYLAEASPSIFWGIGIHINDFRIHKKGAWTGKNMLGLIIMDIRAILKNESSNPTFVSGIDNIIPRPQEFFSKWL
ncbi:NADAR family protein [Vibrio fortis]|uniref:NADAR family protein n=1 Tax=Vibrio fortis TaxID=212667 RepID=UPI0040689335